MKRHENVETKYLSKSISLILAFCMIFSALAVSPIQAEAADSVSVKIVSFNRGEQEDLRSSELLEAKVEGYSGNSHDLTYKWTNGLGTYLYVYNSHNMYGINNTDGEIEIYNNNVSTSENMSGRSYKDSFTGKGYAWAAVYGANLSNSALVGTVTVEVYDSNGNLLATDSHTGERVRTGTIWGFIPVYEYSGFVESNIDEDLKNIAFGMFEGDVKHINDLLGETGMVHVTCAECSVSSAEITGGEDYINVVSDSEAHSIYGIKKGIGTVAIKVEKSNCKFHQSTSTTTDVQVYVYRKPTTTSTATKIELRNLDPDCEYRINHEKGIRTTVDGEEIVIFENLTPNTEYQIGVIGHEEGIDHDPVYAFVYETTKPAHVGTVEVILNGKYDMDTSTASGERVNISTVMEDCETLYLRYEDSELYFPLENKETGIYSAVLSDGNYTIYSAQSPFAQIGEQELTIAGGSRTRELFFNSVQYNLDGGTGGPDKLTEYYLSFSNVNVSDKIPSKEGYLFSHWSDSNGNSYYPGDLLSEDISEPYTLTANYVEATDVYVNITIKHISDSGDHNTDNGRHDITFTLDGRDSGESDYTELISKTIDWNGVDSFNSDEFTAQHVENDEEDYTVYTSKTPVLTNVEKAKEYTFTTSKSGYKRENVTTEIDSNGNYQMNVELVYEPNRFDIAFSVELDEQAKKVPDEFKPVAANIKILQWYDSPYVDGETVDWYTTSRQQYTYERVVIGKDGKGAGTFPVPIATTDGYSPYYYRMEIVSYELADGTVLAAKDFNNAHTTYVTADSRYWANIEVTDGKDPVSTDSNNLTGVWYENGAQQGGINAVISIEVFDVTVNPNGGTINSSTNNILLKDQIEVPNISQYIPTRDGGYVFDGWYYADANGNITSTAANSGDELHLDVVIMAKWKEPLTVSGTVTVSATYTVFNEETGVSYTQTIPEGDRANSVFVALQRIDHTGYPETIMHLTVPVVYNGSTGSGTYEFSGIPDNHHDYRIKVISANYETVYQNALSSSTSVNNFTAYDENHYTAVFSSGTEAFVNAYLHFVPTSFDLKYKLDASRIGEGFRPDSVETLVLCDDGTKGSNPQNWTVITQMVSSSGIHGQNTPIINGIGNNDFSVWNEKPDGVTLYDYSIKVKSYVKDGQAVEYVETEEPFRITYNGSARYDEVNGQTQELVALLVPRMYAITYDFGDIGEDAVTNMEDYLDMSGNFIDYYYWSRGKTITAAPHREGYVFSGWYNENSELVTEIDASMSENITLYAKWIAAPEFETLADAGYYSKTREGSNKVGVISLNSRIKDIAKVGNYIVRFGMYIYNEFSEEVTSAESADISSVIANDGQFHVIISNIAETNFAKEVMAMPYVVVDTDSNLNTEDDRKVYFGDYFKASVQSVNKWLGNDNPYLN